MLVLNRKPGERIVVDNGRLVITLVNVRGEVARLGFTAEKEVEVDREEVWKQKQRKETAND